MSEKDIKDKVKELTDQLEDGIQELFESEHYKEYLRTMGKFYNYSFNNCLLIMLQKPDATRVASYNAWPAKFGRHVKKGEKAIQILSPTPYKQKVQRDVLDPDTGKTVRDENGEIKKEEVEVTRTGFKVAYVFDYGQTEGKPLPELSSRLEGSVENYPEIFQILRDISPVPIGFEQIESGANGYYNFAEKRIAIQEGMSEEQNVKTGIHEIAHAILHDPETLKISGQKTDRITKEIEAESIAFVVSSRFKIDSSRYTFGYLAGWSGDKKMPQLKASLKTIQKTAAKMIEMVEARYLELHPEERIEQQSSQEERTEGVREKEEKKEQQREEPDKVERQSKQSVQRKKTTR